MTNSLGQNPCLVNSYIDGSCFSDGDWTTSKVPGDGKTYQGPDSDTANSCTCSSVAFSLVSACAICQGAPAIQWSDYIANCSSSEVTNGGYPNGIPAGTAVPAWAFTTIDTEADEWDEDAAKTLVQNGAPDAVGTATPPGTSTAKLGSTTTKKTNPPTAPVGSLATSSVHPSSTTATKKKNVGPIVGGVLGGVVASALAIVLIFFRKYLSFKKKENQDDRQSNNFGDPSQPQSSDSGNEKYAPESGVDPLYPAVPPQVYDPFGKVQDLTANATNNGNLTANLTNNGFFGAITHAV
ncbi:hypothetical protein C8Q75DRAFT_809165 [Abortiporus biennis]|nr:hypothetical protein C8Q75DRAFT_809165 [Abortiporus biennis]